MKKPVLSKALKNRREKKKAIMTLEFQRLQKLVSDVESALDSGEPIDLEKANEYEALVNKHQAELAKKLQKKMNRRKSRGRRQ